MIAVIFLYMLLLGGLIVYFARLQREALVQSDAWTAKIVEQGISDTKQLVSERAAQLTETIAVLRDDMTAALLRLQDDAVTRISEIQAQPAEVVRVEVPIPAPITAAVPAPLVPSRDRSMPPARQPVTLILMDSHEQQELHRVDVDPARRSRTVTVGGVRYSAARETADGFIYKRD